MESVSGQTVPFRLDDVFGGGYGFGAGNGSGKGGKS